MSDTWNRVKDLIGGAAPLVGTLVGGPAGGAVGTLLSSALGVEDTPEAIETELRGNPEALVKVRELELTHKTKFEELALENTRAHLADRQDARVAEIERMKAGASNRFMYTLAVLVTAGFFLLCGVLMFKTSAIPEGSREVAFVLFGTLSTAFGGVMQYFFGSSKGSSEKTSLLANKGNS